MSSTTLGTRLWRFIKKHLNFYRVHILFFTFTPLIFSAIFYASNGQNHISYIDALFNCVSAITVCGLATVDLSSLTPWQQVILFIQMCLGTPVVVSWVMVYIRKHYFETKFEHIIRSAAARESVAVPFTEERKNTKWPRRLISFFYRERGIPIMKEDTQSDHDEKERANGGSTKRVRTDMIRRMDDAPKLVNPSGWISEGDRIPMKRNATIQSTSQDRRLSFVTPLPSMDTTSSRLAPLPRKMSRRLSDPGTPTVPTVNSAPLHRFETIAPQSRPHSPTLPQSPTLETQPSAVNHPVSPISSTLPRTQTVEFNLPRRRPRRGTSVGRDAELPASDSVQPEDRRSLHRMSMQNAPFTSHPTTHTYNSHISISQATKHSGFGGFPMPHEIVQALIKEFFPGLRRKLTRTVTIPLTHTIASQHGANVPPGAKPVPYISFEAVVGRNSAFPMLSEDQLEELGGVEYRALNALLWIVAGYHILVQLIAFVIVVPYISQAKWRDDFNPPALHRPVAPAWFALFQMVSAYTNTGTSLVDTSMVPFQTAYIMIIAIVILILAGNTAFPIFLRFTIWILTKLVPKASRANETLHFLLDHPRRCFIYLFPSHQTWFLLTVVIGLTLTDWFFFLVLDIGTTEFESIPVGIRFIVGLLQATAVRAAGFGIVPLAALAPAVKVLYVIMMYISVYPIAMSVRSTNVYEEQSLGVYRGEESDDEDEFQAAGPRVTVWSRYLAMHARKQLAFDMWWLCLGLFLVCIIERSSLDDENSATWFNIFSIIFEMVSAYGTVGLSLGAPMVNYSFSGTLRPLSKLIFCVIMLRGRHRGLPVAIDRAVMLPQDIQKYDEVEARSMNMGDRDDFFARSSTIRNSDFPNGGHVMSEKQPSIMEEARSNID
ncbi:potassium transporter [Moniliophthora roreri MCA 2997]|uniref:Potassium transport protein n=2 Tax=Moniliophthora roreri TaxID=221103 RepID=V2Z059_MONRO|nr:potassium transporter [Moniliophthora roreri MCA 2997]